MAGISCGVIGLPNVGKSTLFNALTRGGARVESYPFCTIEPNVGVIPVPDARLAALNAVEHRPNAIPAVIEFIDIAGLVEGASRGEGRGNQFLENVHDADLLVHVVRCFRDASVAHVSADIDPVADLQTITLELILADLQMTENALARLEKKARGGAAAGTDARAVLEAMRAHLETESPARALSLTPEQRAAVREYRFLTAKPVLYVANVGEASLPDMRTAEVNALAAAATREGSQVLPVCAKVEAEIGELPAAEGAEFLAAMGLAESGLNRLIRACYEQLGLITFFTVGDQEVRAWTVRAGATAPEAGAVIHTDFQDLFIRAEVTAFEAFAQAGSRQAAKDQGHMRIEGKDYLVRDGDIIHFRIGR